MSTSSAGSRPWVSAWPWCSASTSAGGTSGTGWAQVRAASVSSAWRTVLINSCQSLLNICTYDVLHLSAGCNTAVYIYIYTVSIQSLLSGDKCVFSDLSSTTLLPLIKISWGSTITEKCTMVRWCQVLSTMFVDNRFWQNSFSWY